MSKLNDIIERLAVLTSSLADDISLASTRIEHIRVTTRANEANNILTDLMNLNPEDDSEQEG